jgi:hypothetical protein
MSEDKEKQIDLSSSDVRDVVGENQPADGNIFRPVKSKVQYPDIAASTDKMSDDELINAIIMAPDDMFMPWEEVTLPSLGLYYDGWTNGTVRVRPMIQAIEKNFANQRMTQNGTALETMYRYCVELPGDEDPINLLVGDRTFLLYCIRGITYGNLYKFVTKCPNCGTQNSHVYDMNELYETVIPADPGMGPEPFRLDLPHISSSVGREVYVGVRFLRGYDIKDSVDRQRFNKKITSNSNVRTRNKVNRGSQQSSDDQTSTILDDSIIKSVVHVNGSRDPGIISNFISKLHSADHSIIKEFLKDKTPSMDTSLDITCTECGNEASTALPITAGFFQSVNQ